MSFTDYIASNIATVKSPLNFTIASVFNLLSTAKEVHSPLFLILWQFGRLTVY